MEWFLRPWHLTILAIASWMNREQHQLIRYLETENAVLREKLGKRRILLSDDQRRRLAIKGKELDRKGLSQTSTLFTPDTILRWHRELVARKWDYSERRRVSRVGLAYDWGSAKSLFEWPRTTQHGATTESKVR